MSSNTLPSDWINTLSSVEQKINSIMSFCIASSERQDVMKTQADTVSPKDPRCKETIRPRV
ncbi:hypothetical protein A3742_26805 [Oleiphilus sp. HI0071]|jgi:hypothetical protein|uniref:hypothetical protein n=1 Tax=unclassified Oleiphilus TaxID=2631174 RepID=UPI0007C3AC47|nr:MULTISPECIES: hypothetical protein [unclassified Oleiphilus]KZY62346.1 hypothetical protein A3737_05085 [Oleiphilus sp. HI0065]KZY78900.1 hypothetical protein A3742_14890 [Oleiphilus sp. HI0071]KZY91818.1 hypothetical protein A3744_02955 [Oleiphilus sp. HI0073]KZZ47081.1 hypothetical protein A3758_35500 [Oleiphilus sp. HI0118]KZZ48699.1 hypothetical protein A3760_03385 [Oleiphilus sp. HI0122]KZZ72331.1 hypothetical protein A3765_13205 [Oleiphilus sp. HI0130]KZZ77811.1 hypothetical protein